MANTVIAVLRTSTSGRVPTVGATFSAGVLALNMPDQVLYTTNGSVVFPVGGYQPQATAHFLYGGA